MFDRSPLQVVVKYGFPVKTIGFGFIKLITTFLSLLLATTIPYSVYLLLSAIQIRTHLGYFIDMIVTGDGDILPSLQAMPVLFFLTTNLAMALFLFAAFDNVERPSLNLYMFLIWVFALLLLVVILVIIICVITHAYSTHQSLHDGIMTAMKNYSTSVVHKMQMDQLQIEFQCCGSKKYDDWYTIQWMDRGLEEGSSSSLAEGNTPFSCCSINTLFPCIHHSIENTGKAYLYTPEFNLSISTRGCYDVIREQKQKVGWVIVGHLTLYLILQAVSMVLFRLIQTAHYEYSRFYGHSRNYTFWIFGYYMGRVKPGPPKPPPVPDELKD